MKIALLQCDVITGDPAGNAATLIAACRASHADLCVAPLEALCGPEPDFFLRLPHFAALCKQTVELMARELENGSPLICGHPFMGGNAILISGGSCIDLADNFYLRNHCLRVENYIGGSCQTSGSRGADILLQISATRFAPGRQEKKEKEEAMAACAQGQWRLSPNLAGGYDGIIYSGQSLAFDPCGRMWARGSAFGEDVVIVDLDTPVPGKIAPLCADLCEEQWKGLVLGVGDFTRKAGAHGALLGLSGGMDSALVACIAADALGPENVTGIMMPSPWTSDASLADAQALAGNLGINTFTLPIAGIMDGLEKTLAPILEHYAPRPGDLTFENLQARIRGILLMATANRSGAIVLNTGNKSELAMGYCTLYGDTVGALAVLGDIFKTRVYELAKWYCHKHGEMVIPQNIFDKAPSAELRPNQKDTDSLPPYETLDPILENLLGRRPNTENLPQAEEIAQKVIANRFKARQCPPPIMVGREHLSARQDI